MAAPTLAPTDFGITFALYQSATDSSSISFGVAILSLALPCAGTFTPRIGCSFSQCHSLMAVEQADDSSTHSRRTLAEVTDSSRLSRHEAKSGCLSSASFTLAISSRRIRLIRRRSQRSPFLVGDTSSRHCSEAHTSE